MFPSKEDQRAPVLSADGLTIYWTRADPTGKYDIYVAHRPSPNIPFDGGETRVAELSSPAAEFAGWISPDGCALYFWSDADGQDTLYVASKR